MTSTLPRVSAGRANSAGCPPLLDASVTFPTGIDLPVTREIADDLPAHLARYGERPRTTGPAGARLIDTLDQLRLDGRGGAHFPVAAKWRAHLAAGGDGIVVANGAESEPASAKDAALVQLRPHLVLDGLACAAEAVGARQTVVWLHQDARASRLSLVRALAERRSHRLGEADVPIRLGPSRYLSGESGAIVRALTGGPALPDFRRVPAAVTGVNGRPTLVQNVETLARIALAARPEALIGTSTSLLTVATMHGRTVVEVPYATPLHQVIDWVLGPGASRAQQAVLLGGYGGVWIGHQLVHRLRADESDANAYGLSLGAGVVAPIDHATCGLAETSAIAHYLAENSARQCGPCLFGLRALAQLLEAVVDLRAEHRDARRLEGLLDQVRGRGACHHPDGAVRMIASALRVFEADLRAHLRGAGCLHAGGSGLFSRWSGARNRD